MPCWLLGVNCQWRELFTGMQILGLGGPIPEMGWKQWSLQGCSCGATGWPLGPLSLWESGPGPFAAAIVLGAQTLEFSFLPLLVPGWLTCLFWCHDPLLWLPAQCPIPRLPHSGGEGGGQPSYRPAPHLVPHVSRDLLPAIHMLCSSGSYKWSESSSVMSDSSLRGHGLYSPWNSLGQNTAVDSPSLLHGIFPTQGSNPGLLHCGWILYQLSHKGRPFTGSYKDQV